MGLINSFTQVVSNRKKFKNWEQQDKEKAAKREILQQKQILQTSYFSVLQFRQFQYSDGDIMS